MCVRGYNVRDRVDSAESLQIDFFFDFLQHSLDTKAPKVSATQAYAQQTHTHTIGLLHSGGLHAGEIRTGRGLSHGNGTNPLTARHL